MPIRQEKLIIGTKEDIFNYLEDTYGIIENDDREGGESFWLPSLSYDTQVDKILRANSHGFGLIIFVRGHDITAEDESTADEEGIVAMEYTMTTVHVWIRGQNSQEEYLETLKKEAQSYSNKNILTNMKLEE